MVINKGRSPLILLLLWSGLGALGCSPQNNRAMAEVSTVFQCQQQGDQWATMARRDNLVSKNPLFTWKTVEFGDDWTPEKRCNHVANKLTTLVAANGGKLGNLTLTYGKLDTGYTVICVINSQEKTCNQNNMLFTLNEKNSQNPGQVLLKITNFADGKEEGVTIDENGQPQYISLGAIVDRSLGQVW
jgi:hypothetical protein